MTLEYDCPYCAHSFSIERAAAGSDVSCPSCHVFVTLPVGLKMSKREARRKLFPLAIVLLIGALAHLLVLGTVLFLLATSDDFPPKDLDDPAIFYAVGVVSFLIALVPALLMLLGSRAMFRAQNYRLAVAGTTIAGGLGACCCLPLLGVSYWGRSILSDPLLRQAMD